jgi:pyruvate formate lyase activating enzyme
MAERGPSRREFLTAAARWSALAGAGALCASDPVHRLLGLDPEAQELRELIKKAPRARYWLAQGDSSCASCHEQGIDPKAKYRHGERAVQCLLCAHRCAISDGERGRCGARMNVRGELRSLVYGRPITEHVDPIEKKPFFHFLPGAAAYSLATSGCPLRCLFCQNWEISQAKPEDYAVQPCPPEAMARRARQASAPVVAFTYNEPTVFVEYLTDVAREAKKMAVRSVLVSCGFMNEAPLAEMIEVLDAIKIDLKGYSPEFYRKVSGAELQPVLRSIRQVAKAGRHLEIVNLVVPTLNDSAAMLTELSKWVAGEAGTEVPLHFTRFHPDYQLLNLPPTPVSTLEQARETAMKQGLKYVYVGNVPGHPGNHTYCPQCGKVVIERSGFFTVKISMKLGACAFCGRKIAGVWV